MFGLPLGSRNHLEFTESDINTGKVRCGSKNNLNLCHFSDSKVKYWELPLIKKFLCKIMTILTKFDEK